MRLSSLTPGGCFPKRGPWRRPPYAWPCGPANRGRSLPVCVRKARCRRSSRHPTQGAACSSRFLISSHSLPLPRPFMWTRAKSPFNFSPSRRNLRSPARDLFVAGCFAEQPEPAAVPEHHAACAVVARRDVAFEAAVVQGMVFHMRRPGGAPRDPGWGPLGTAHDFRTPPHLQPEIVVEPSGVVPLHTKSKWSLSRSFLPGGGSGVFSNRRLAAYSSSAITPYLSSVYILSVSVVSC